MSGTGLIGLGAMGLPIARRMLDSGLRVHALDVNAAAMAAAVQVGAIPAADIAAVAAQCDLVLVSMSTEQALLEVVGELMAQLPPSSIIVDIGTTAVAQTRALAARAAAAGIGYVDAPVSGSVPWAEQGRLTMMVGGAEGDYQRCRPVFETFARQIFYLGNSGSGQIVKLCHQLVFFALTCSLSEGLAMAAREGVARDNVLAAIDASVAPNHAMAFLLPAVAQGNFRGADMQIAGKDMAAVLELAKQLGFDAPLATQVSKYFDTFIARKQVDYNLFGVLDLIAGEGFAREESARPDDLKSP